MFKFKSDRPYLMRIARGFGLLCLLMTFSLPSVGQDDGRFKNGMVQYLTNIDQSCLRSSRGSLYGLEDERGRIILPEIYSDIEYCGHGLFLATDLQVWDRFYFGDKRHFFNRDGVESLYKLPEGAFLFSIFSFGDVADRQPDLILDELPEDTILLFGYKDEPEGRKIYAPKQGLCNIEGKILLPPVDGKVLFFQPGKALLLEKSNKRAIVDLKTWTSEPTNIQFEVGKIIQPRIPKINSYSNTMPLPKDRVVTESSSIDRQFNSDYWRARRDYPVKRLAMFGRFLKEYNLIGMPKDKVAVLLGESERQHGSVSERDFFTYIFPTHSCTGEYDGIRVYFKNEAVSSWSFISGNSFGYDVQESTLKSTNVVLKQARTGFVSSRLGKMTLSIGVRGTEVVFPEVEEKFVRVGAPTEVIKDEH